MTWKPRWRDRLDGLTPEQAIVHLADGLDIIEGIQDEHIAEDEAAFKAVAEQFNEWKLSSLRFQRNQLIGVATVVFIAMLGAVLNAAIR